jgi:hypothetical protein
VGGGCGEIRHHREKTVKTTLTLVLLLANSGVIAANAQGVLENVELVGMTVLGTTNAALLSGVESGRFKRTHRLTAHSRWFDVEVTSVDPYSGIVTIQQDGKQKEFSLAAPLLPLDEKIGPDGIAMRVEGADTDTMLELLAVVSGRSVLRHPALAATNFVLNTKVVDRASALLQIRDALRLNGIETEFDGNKFVMVVPTGFSKSMLPPTTLSIGNTNAAAVYVPYSCNFLGLETFEFIDKILAPTIGRTIHQSSNLPGKIHFWNQTPLNQSEMVYAYERLLALNGVTLKYVDDATLEAVVQETPPGATPAKSATKKKGL